MASEALQIAVEQAHTALALTEPDATAPLIAAAPELAAALEPFVEVIENFEAGSAWNTKANDLLSVCNILNHYGKINLGHLRQARAALAPLERG